jgi:2-polyprenyl-3-methyl-5-hydroxy-6-metoxy-1,4-benzoquinol methylase
MERRVLTNRRLLNKLPPPVARLLKSAYERWQSAVTIDRGMTHTLAEYFGVTYKEAVCLLRVATHLNKEIWNILRPQRDDDIVQFYRVNPFYIFSLAYWHMSRAQRQFRRVIVRLSKGHVLDYGGGIGDLTLALAQAGLKVTYVDIGGRTFDFAKWLLERSGYTSILMLDAVRDQERIWADEYDTIICIDVIEHVPHPEQLLEKIAASLRDKGALVITGLNSKTDNKEHPMHLPVTFDSETLLNSLGLYQSKSHDWLWIKESLKRK